MQEKHILIEFFGTHHNGRMILHAPASGEKLNIQINSDGDLKILKTEERCKVCEGKRGIKYWYAQDETVTVDCPVCNGGSQNLWDIEAKNWNDFLSKGRRW